MLEGLLSIASVVLIDDSKKSNDYWCVSKGWQPRAPSVRLHRCSLL